MSGKTGMGRLFGRSVVIPSDPLWRHNSTGETAKDAAAFIKPKAQTLRQRVLEAIEQQSGTPEEIHARLQAAGANHLLTAVRPRCSELVRLGLIKDSGNRGLGESRRCKSIVWTATTPEEREAWAAAQAAEKAA